MVGGVPRDRAAADEPWAAGKSTSSSRRIHYRRLTHTDVVARLLALAYTHTTEPASERGSDPRRRRKQREAANTQSQTGTKTGNYLVKHRREFERSGSAGNSQGRRRHRAKCDGQSQPEGE